MNPHKDRIELLRIQMRKKKCDINIIHNTDPHLGEYIPGHWCIIKWLTGFTGSAATVVVTNDSAGLWTDSRYFLQAEKQLKGSGISLMKSGTDTSGDYLEWTVSQCSPGNRIAFDGRIFPLTRFRKLEKLVRDKKIKISYDMDLISSLWTDRPEPPFSEAFEHDLDFCGLDRDEKIARVRERLIKYDADYSLLTSPDDIMWLLNIRGGDIEFSPLIQSFALVGKEQVLLFVDVQKIPYKLASKFDKSGIVILPYEAVSSVLSTLSDSEVLLINPSSTSVSLYKSISGKISVKEDISITSGLKAVKNKTEIAGLSKAMIRDGVALTEFFFWFERTMGAIPMSEISLAEKLKEFRSQQENFLGLSFRTIVAFREHSALPHYSPDEDSSSNITGNGILLIDSGGQYLDGTTDITRTIATGRPSEKQMKDYTLVLKGMIALSKARFPVFTKGIQLDILARKFLWDSGMNYGHGTGHGVGYCLNVHEGPVSISPGGSSDPSSGIEPGMVISNEPAIYRDGEYGIRTENLILSYEDEENEFGRFLGFETISLCYLEKKLIDKALLDDHEIRWLNNYHSEVYNKLSPFLEREEKLWLKEKCGPL